MTLREGDLEIDFSDAIDGFVFDQMKPHLPNFHGIAQMHRVDFVVEVPEAIVFVELKDPGHPKAQSEGLAKFNAELIDGTLSQTFASKFVDSFFYRWGENQLNKPIFYLPLVTLETPLVMSLSDEICRKLPPQRKPVERWERSVLEHCQAFNIEMWNESFPAWQVRRLSTATNP